jgi:hypothetical protein
VHDLVDEDSNAFIYSRGPSELVADVLLHALPGGRLPPRLQLGPQQVDSPLQVRRRYESSNSSFVSSSIGRLRSSSEREPRSGSGSSGSAGAWRKGDSTASPRPVSGKTLEKAEKSCEERRSWRKLCLEDDPLFSQAVVSARLSKKSPLWCAPRATHAGAVVSASLRKPLGLKLPHGGRRSHRQKGDLPDACTDRGAGNEASRSSSGACWSRGDGDPTQAPWSLVSAALQRKRTRCATALVGFG